MVVHQDGVWDCNERLPHPQCLKEAARASMTNDKLSFSHVGFKVGCVFKQLNVKPTSYLTFRHALANQLVRNVSSIASLQMQVSCSYMFMTSLSSMQILTRLRNSELCSPKSSHSAGGDLQDDHEQVSKPWDHPYSMRIILSMLQNLAASIMLILHCLHTSLWRQTTWTISFVNFWANNSCAKCALSTAAMSASNLVVPTVTKTVL